MLDKVALHQRVISLGLTQYWPLLERLVRPAIYIDASPEDDSVAAIGCSKSGGAPDVPPDFVWPQDDYGPRKFLAQINLSEVHPFDIEGLLPATGLLSFFVDSEGFGGEGIPGDDPVFYFPDTTVLGPSSFPEGYDGYSACSVYSFYSGWSLPDTEEKFGFRWNTPDREEDYKKLWILYGFNPDESGYPIPDAQKHPNLFARCTGEHLLGHPCDYQGALEPKAEMACRGVLTYPADGSEEEQRAYIQLYKDIAPQAYQDWVCLFHEGSYTGGVFTIDYLIRREDLAKADFSKTVAFSVN